MLVQSFNLDHKVRGRVVVVVVVVVRRLFLHHGAGQPAPGQHQRRPNKRVGLQLVRVLEVVERAETLLLWLLLTTRQRSEKIRRKSQQHSAFHTQPTRAKDWIRISSVRVVLGPSEEA